MKTYSEYMIDINDRFDWLDEIVTHHCFIKEMYLNSNISSYHTFESIGLFPGCREIVNYFMDHLDEWIGKKHYVIKAVNVNGLNEQYFNEIHIKFLNDDEIYVHGKYLAGYHNDKFDETYDKTRWNEELKKFNFIDISIYNASEKLKNSVAEVFTHELVHLWDDYMIHKKSYLSYRDKTLKFKLKEQINILAKADKNNNESLNLMQQIVYFLDKFEVKAYIAQIDKELDKYELYNINDAIDVIRNNNIYKTYKYIYELLLDDDNKWLIENGFTISQLKKMKKLVSDAWNKIVNHTYLACIDHLKEPINCGSSPISLFDMMTPPWKRRKTTFNIQKT